MAIQWHPLFAQLLRPLLQGYFDVQIDVPVGDVPRQADVVVLRRTTAKPLPFRGLWRHLTTWNVLEYKGPAVSARLEHLDLLVELGLGIQRRLNQERSKTKQASVPAAEVSFWYLPHHVGRRFLKRAARKLGTLQPHDQGIWRGLILERTLYVVSGGELPEEAESLPFHLLEVDAPDKGLSVARLIVQQPSLWDMYTQFLGSLHPEILQELEAMARTSKKGPQFHLKPLADLMGMKEVIQQLGAREIISEMGVKKVIDEMGVKKVIDEMGVKKVIDEVGVKKIIDEVGVKKVIDEVGVKKIIDEVLSQLSDADRAALQRRLEAERRKK